MFPVCDVIPSKTRPFVTLGLIAITTLVFGYLLALDRRELQRFAYTFGVVPASLDWLTPLTSLFLHGGWIPFAGNVLGLWIFGENVEDALGHVRFLLFYLAAGSIGALARAALDPEWPMPLIGAGGAVAAVMGAYFGLYPRSRILTAVVLIRGLDVIEVPALFFLGLWLAVQAIGGAVAGAQAVDILDAFAGPVTGFLVGIPAGVAARKARRWQ
jgi:membrane associated rhomboid family serine protease